MNDATRQRWFRNVERPRPSRQAWVGLTALALVLAACGGGEETADVPAEEAPAPAAVASGAMVGADGAVVSSPDGRFSLEIPAGALAEDTPISIDTISAADVGVDGSAVAGGVYLLEPAGLRFDQPVVTTRHLSASDLGIADDEVPFVFELHGDADGWEVLDTSTTRVGDDVIITAPITHFSVNMAVAVFDGTITLAMSPMSFSASVGGAETVTFGTTRAGEFDAVVESTNLSVEGALTDFEAVSERDGQGTGRATCGPQEGEGSYSVVIVGEARDSDAMRLWLMGLFQMHVTDDVDDRAFSAEVTGLATCTGPAAKAAAGGEAREQNDEIAPAGPPNSSFFVEVLDGEASGAGVYEGETYAGPNDSAVTPFVLARTPIPDAGSQIFLRALPLSDDGVPLASVELFQEGGERQGCVGHPPSGVFVTNGVPLDHGGDVAWCRQAHDPGEPATLFIYLTVDATVEVFAIEIEPFQRSDVGEFLFDDGGAAMRWGDRSEIVFDTDPNGLQGLHDWAAGSGPGGPASPLPGGPPPFPIIGLSAEVTDAVRIVIQFGDPFDPAPTVAAAGIGFRYDTGTGLSLIGGTNHVEGELFSGVTCLPDPEADGCDQIVVAASSNADGTEWAWDFAAPPDFLRPSPDAQVSASAFFQETAEDPESYQQFGPQPLN